MKANCEDVPYATDKVGGGVSCARQQSPGQAFAWQQSPLLCARTPMHQLPEASRPRPLACAQGKNTTWVFVLSYARLDEVLPLAHECLAASRLPLVERCGAGLGAGRAGRANWLRLHLPCPPPPGQPT
jgi:hypothetical protein